MFLPTDLAHHARAIGREPFDLAEVSPWLAFGRGAFRARRQRHADGHKGDRRARVDLAGHGCGMIRVYHATTAAKTAARKIRTPIMARLGPPLDIS